MRRRFWFGILAASAIGLTYRTLLRIQPLKQSAAPYPAADYAEAMRRLQTLQGEESSDLNPLCRTQLLDHGRKTERVAVLFHGYSNCPHQYHQFAPRLHELGYNVLVTRLPRHGYADPTGPQVAHLTADELVYLANTSIDIARGLGERVTLFGLSLGGLVAAWAAQHRADVDKALLVAPSFGIASVTPSRYRLYANLLALLPNRFEWWDVERKDERNGPTHAYAGYSTRGIATLLHLSLIVQAEARRRAPAARKITVFTNPSDEVVRNGVTAQVVENWRKNGVAVHAYECPADWELIHDLMDAQQEGQQIEVVYPQLIDLMVGEM